ncbi:protein adenylyltransferase SelO [Paraliomyxa miuraensis]|uniref:protein adenylyltransferase SelO n=1 Tax=Paraliomyxa miuraensis TaxID=376150 RepID=UPI0022507626|nr:YdiU family protein [Paraliomyxa miuraensis]MCX4247440.1 YdiU family protein [Paraliomyxa miuraensis]
MPPDRPYSPSRAIAELPEGFFDVVEPAAFPQHTLRFRNQRWAERVGLHTLHDDEWEAAFARFEPLPGSLPLPLAMRYHGHQFRAYNPDLGDGRGFLFAQLHDGVDGRLLDLGTKGSGTTPYSRGGDGRLTLKGGVREILATEMLEALGVRTSKTFSLFETGESLLRGDEPSPTRSSVLVRLGHSHLRFGSFQRHAHQGRPDRVRLLADHCIAHHYPSLGDAADPYRALYGEIARRTVALTGGWMVAGFVHGVLNTDNMNVTGESFDYGPWRWLPRYDPMFTAAYFDRSGLYAFGRQPEAAAWNLTRLAETFDGVTPPRELLDDLREGFSSWLEAAVVEGVLERLGLRARGRESDARLVDALYVFLARSRVGYDQAFFDLYGGMASTTRWGSSPEAVAYEHDGFGPVRAMLEAYEPTEHAAWALAAEPYFLQRTRPESMLIEEVEALWSAIDERDDWQPLHAKIEAVRAMGRALGRREPISSSPGPQPGPHPNRARGR